MQSRLSNHTLQALLLILLASPQGWSEVVEKAPPLVGSAVDTEEGEEDEATAAMDSTPEASGPDPEVPEVPEVPEEEKPLISEVQPAMPDEMIPFPEPGPGVEQGTGEIELLPMDTGNSEVVPYLIPDGEIPNDLSFVMQPEEFTETPVDVQGEFGTEQDEAVTLENSPSYIGFSQGNYSYLMGGGPTGFNGDAPLIDGMALLSGVTFLANFGSSYDSNITQATGAAGDPVVDAFMMSLGGTVSYRSKGREWIFGGHYTGDLELYTENSDFNGYDQYASAFLTYEGAKLGATLTAELARESGGNRFYGPSAFVEQTRIGFGLYSTYELGPKTLVTADANFNHTTATGGNFEDTTSFSAGIAAFWRYSPITRFGPGVRFTADLNGDNDRTSIGPTLNLNYRLSSKVSLDSRVGLDFISYSNGGSSDPSTSALLALNWNASRLWGMDLSVYRDTESDPLISDSFNEITGIRVGYHRKIRRVNLKLGIGYEMAETVGNGDRKAVPDRPDRAYLNVDAALEMLIFRDTTTARLFIRYSDQNGGRAESFDSTLIGFSLTKTF